MKKLLAVLFSALVSTSAMAEKPLIVVGASFANGVTPFNDQLQAPLGGISVGFGSYLSLGDALVRDRRLSGHVINEAQAGATTFDRMVCNPVCDPDVTWQSYDKQLTKALARVTMRDPATGDVVDVNADYVIIALPNDCLHSDAFGIPQDEAQPCDQADFDAQADRLVALGQRVIDAGLTPIFNIPPQYDQMDLPYFQSAFGLNWAIDKADYEMMTATRFERIRAELPEAVQLKVWNHFVHLGDGIHPNRKSVRKAAKAIAKFIKANEDKVAE